MPFEHTLYVTTSVRFNGCVRSLEIVEEDSHVEDMVHGMSDVIVEIVWIVLLCFPMRGDILV